MKTRFFCLLLLTLATGSIKAQLANTKWKGVLKLDDPLHVSFNFGKDTLVVIALDDNSIVETMTYRLKDSALTLKKVSGQSDCETASIGKYKYQLKEKSIVLTVVEDACNDRAPYLDNLQLTKNQ